jgi:general stress protein 26/nucleoside-triphosphatase THEP1
MPGASGTPQRIDPAREAFDRELLAAVAARLASAAGPGRGNPLGPVIVSGGIGAGKTEAGLRLAQRLKQDGTAIGGILAPRLFERGETTGYNVLDLATGEDAVFARPDPPGHLVGRFYVRPGGLAFADRALRGGADRASVVFVDEVGRWELGGGGHASALRAVLESRGVPILFVRAELVENVVDHFGLRSAYIARLVESMRRETPQGHRSFWSIVDSTPYPLLVTLAADGFPQSRPMTVAARDEHTLWFPMSRRSRKVEQIRAHSKATVLFVDTDRYNYASFCGLASLDSDHERAHRLWRAEWQDDWPQGPDDPDYALLRIDGVRGVFLHGPTGEAGEIDLRGASDM